MTDFWEAALSWLPPAVTSAEEWFQVRGARPWINAHLVWSLLTGLGVGLILVRRAALTVTIGGILLFLVGLDHAVVNSDGSTWLYQTFGPWMESLYSRLSNMAWLALIAAYALDRRTASVDEDLRLPEEIKTSPAVLGLWTTAARGLPRSVLSVADYVRRRRMYTNAGAQDDALKAMKADLLARRAALLAVSEQICVLHARRVRQYGGGALAVIAVLPGFLRFFVGGWLQTAGVQEAMANGWDRRLLLLASLIAGVVLLRQVLSFAAGLAAVLRNDQVKAVAPRPIRTEMTNDLRRDEIAGEPECYRSLENLQTG